jgi:hypothetical protein
MSAFFNSLFGGETKTTTISSNKTAETLGAPPTLSSNSSPSAKNFASFRQISLPGEWSHGKLESLP